MHQHCKGRSSRFRRANRAENRTPAISWAKARFDVADLVTVAVLYIVVVALFKLAFGVFGTGNTAGLFLSYAAAMLLGTLGPIVYTVWVRRRSLESIGIGLHNLPATAALGVLFAAVQFSVTLLGQALPPDAVDWVPLLLMSLTVGVFEAIFFRGFVQGTLEPSFGIAPAVAVSAALYALYHFGYGMGAGEMVFLFGLGTVYAIAYRITHNLVAIWPLLTPMGGFFVQLRSGDLAGQLPWMSMAGFGDVLFVIALAVFFAARHERRGRRRAELPAPSRLAAS